jgi:hypothetical protein
VTSDEPTWRRLCGLGVAICGSQEKFRRESNVLRRLVVRFGPSEVEHMLHGAKTLGWNSLIGLGGADGLGRRWALQAHWQAQKQGPPMRSLGAILRKAMKTP